MFSLRNEKHSPLFATLKKYAHASGKKLVVTMVCLFVSPATDGFVAVGVGHGNELLERGEA